MHDVAESLLNWYDHAKRDLPWRKERDPYRILVSEIMLQQTRVETVIPYYERFLQSFPTLADLAAADEERVLEHWTGLGYYRRARNLHRAVREIQSRYEGRLPEEPDQLRQLPGIGRYTAAAVASIAYDHPVAAVDGNVLRVVARLKSIREPINKPSIMRQVEEIVTDWIPADRAGDFTQALMELGSLVCLPKNPRCLDCPVQRHCAAFQTGKVAELPVRLKESPPMEEQVVVLAAVYQEAVWLERRPTGGLLGGMWQFPNIIVHDGADPLTILEERFHVSMLSDVPLQKLKPYRHRFSHRIWNLIPFRIEVSGAVYSQGMTLSDEGEWQPLQKVDQLAIPNAFMPLVRACRMHSEV